MVTARGDLSWRRWALAPAARRGQRANKGWSTHCSATPIENGRGSQVSEHHKGQKSVCRAWNLFWREATRLRLGDARTFNRVDQPQSCQPTPPPNPRLPRLVTLLCWWAMGVAPARRAPVQLTVPSSPGCAPWQLELLCCTSWRPLLSFACEHACSPCNPCSGGVPAEQGRHPASAGSWRQRCRSEPPAPEPAQAAAGRTVCAAALAARARGVVGAAALRLCWNNGAAVAASAGGAWPASSARIVGKRPQAIVFRGHAPDATLFYVPLSATNFICKPFEVL